MTGREHLAALHEALLRLDAEVEAVERWGARLASRLGGGARLLVAGNGGSAAHAQHLTAELVGRYLHERHPLSAIALHADTSSLTAIVNDYGGREAFARQVRAHGREGDVLLAISTSGRSENLIAAVAAAQECGMGAWALTGPAPNPLGSVADEALAVAGRSTATIQEVHQIVIHLLCSAVDEAFARGREVTARTVAL